MDGAACPFVVVTVLFCNAVAVGVAEVVVMVTRRKGKRPSRFASWSLKSGTRIR